MRRNATRHLLLSSRLRVSKLRSLRRRSGFAGGICH